MPKISNAFLQSLELLYKEAGYRIRYEKGNFKSGACTLMENNVLVINKFASLDIKIQFLIELLKTIEFDSNNLSDKSRQLFAELNQTQLF